MAKTVYALLVAIDTYPQPVRPLRGCTNDITRMEMFLRERITGERGELKVRVLTNDAATRDAVIAGFREHLALADQDDVALFYFSGHGSQEPAPKEFWHLEPDHLNETLVCYDSRLPGKYDLADKELAKLIAEVAERQPHIVVVLDSCHSGSGTRAGDDAGLRHTPADTRARPIDAFLKSRLDATAHPARLERADASVPGSRPTSGWIELPEGSHVLLSACQADEEAKEDWLDGEQRGVFSHYLLETLQHTGESMTYRDLFKQVNTSVRGRVARQSPIIEANNSQDLNRPFLGGAIVPRPSYYTLSYQRGVGWVIDGGAVHGIAPVVGDETTTLAVFPAGRILTPLRDLSIALTSARVARVEPHQSWVEIVPPKGTELNTSLTYAAVVTSLPLPRMGVYLEGDAAGVDAVRHALWTVNGGESSLYVAEVGPEQARVCLLAEANHYRFIHPRENRRLIADTPGQYDGPPGYTEDNARLAIERLEHIERWQRLADLFNCPLRLKPGAVQMELVRVADDTDPGDAARSAPPEDVVVAQAGAGVALTNIRLEYRFEHDTWKPPSFLVKLTNTTNEALHCALLGLSQRYGVRSLTPGGSEQLGPGQVTWARGGKSIPATVPDVLWNAGVTEVKDILRLIVSTEPVDALLLEQRHLEAPIDRGASKGVGITHQSTLNRLMQRIQTRDYDEDHTKNVFADWTTSALSTTTMRPLASVPVPAQQTEVYLGHGVTLLGHAGLQATKATARLTTAPEVGRSAGNLLLPEILRQDPNLARPWEFSSSRGGEPGLSALELFDVANAAVVTPDAPLQLRVDAPLSEDEHVLPFAWDGEFFLPLGHIQRQKNGHATVTLERLPASVAFGRDIKGSIRILFQKVVGKYFGSPYRYPLLTVAGLEDTGEVVYSKPEHVQARVAEAQTIVLFIHGIIGDTRGMVRSAYKPEPRVEPRLAELYDLVLAFDYENVNTSIEQTALDLQDRLKAVGLEPGHGKRLHIIAHSLGGLVARWFIEHLDGQAVVEHLIMLGTPNAGSPWPRVQALATAAVGLALNAVTVVPWPLSLLGGLVNGIEVIDVTLDQMQPNAPILDSLWRSRDPHVHYTVIAGNTSVREEALASEAQPARPTRIERLLERLSLQHVLRETTALAFLGQPNDIAVSVASITHVPLNREPRPTIKEIGCDHMTYLRTDAALQTLTNLVAHGPDSRGTGARTP